MKIRPSFTFFFLFTLRAGAFSTSPDGSLLTDGSAIDVQAALDAAPTGGTVVLPNGAFAWDVNVTASGFVHLVAASFGQTTITRTYTAGDQLDINASPDGNTELAGINFVSPFDGSQDNYTYTLSINALSGLPVLVHDCTFVTGYEFAVRFWGNGGVIWNCTFHTTTDIVEGIVFHNVSADDRYWNQPDSMGTQDPNGNLNTYVEDCQFYDADGGAANFDDNSRVVWRHNLMSNAALVSHGQETSPWGTRHWEIYNNQFIRSTSGTAFGGDSYPLNLNYWFECRGGTGAIFGNSFDDIPSKAQVQLNVFSINRMTGQIPCQTAYPAAHQAGQGWSATSDQSFGTPVVARDGLGAILDPLYVWNNTGSATSDPAYVAINQYTPDACGNGEQIAVFLQQNRDYFVNVAKPGYTPAPYPHPLRSGPSPTPTPTPAPTPTPIPTPTPTSTPGPVSSAWSRGLVDALKSAGWAHPMINQALGFVAGDPPWLDAQGDYQVWSAEIDWLLNQAALPTDPFDQYFNANPNPTI